MAKPSSSKKLAKKEVILFLILAFAFSAVCYYLVSTATTHDDLLLYTVMLMFCPATAAVITRLYFQKNLKGFGLGWGKTKWQLLAIFLPILLGLLMFGYVWLTGTAAFNTEQAAEIFSFAFIPTLISALLFNLFAAFGEELGWRGLLVPEMSKFMSFNKLAIISAIIWTLWHFPIIIFGNYSGAGGLVYSLIVFVPQVIGVGFFMAWLRLKSGSVWTAVFFHGLWNYFIQDFYPALTVATAESELITGEFGWLSPILWILIAMLCWHFRYLLPKSIAK